MFDVAQLAQLFVDFPKPLAVMLISMLPFVELRGAIPVALFVYGMDPISAFAYGVVGNMIPVFVLLYFLEPVSNFLRRWHIWDVFFTWLFAKAHRQHSARVERYGMLALALFVAVPLPTTGAWSGCAGAFVFGIKFKHALLSIFAGVVGAGIVVTIVSLGGIGLISLN